MIVSRYSSGIRERNSTPEYKHVSDVIQKKMKEMDRTEESPHSTRSEAMADKLGNGTDADMNASMNSMTSDDSAEANGCQENVTRDKWIAIYRFDKIVAVRVLARFKIYQTLMTTGMGLFSLTSHLLGHPTDRLFFVLCVSAFTSVSLYILGNSCRRVIGFVYLSEDEKQVKIAHTDFWGRRQDRVFLVKHLVPLRDTPAHPYARQLFISQPNFNDKYLFLPIKNATFLDPVTFSVIFGLDPEEQSPTSRAAAIEEDETKK